MFGRFASPVALLQKGAQRGKNAIFLFEVDGLRIVHLGDPGHLLS